MKWKVYSFCIFALLILKPIQAQERNWADEEETSEYWNNMAQEELKEALFRENLNKQVAKNVIMFLGDGMSIPTITTGRILKGQLNNQTGEEFQLAMDKLPHAALSRTYSVDRQTTDSAATATAYLCGVKSIHGTIGLNGKVVRGDCSSSKGQEVDSILVDAFKKGKSTGIITTVHILHASPAGTYAHTPDRSWYSDSRTPDEQEELGCKDIAKQFYESSNMITVAMGGGRQYFRPTSVPDEEALLGRGERQDGRNLIQEWVDDADADEIRKYVWNKTDFDAVDPVKTDRLLGLFGPSEMDYEIDRDDTKQPSIADMTEKAIRILRKNENGYFLFVEGGKIDKGHHDSSGIQALYDAVAFDDAIERAVSMTSESDTLIVVTADHSHTMSFGGYTLRGNPILGITPWKASDGKPFTSILYGNGPGYQRFPTLPVNERQNLTDVNTESRIYRQQTAVPQASESHGGDDVAILAQGPMAHLFHGVHEQNYIAHAMRYAACLGTNQEHCMLSAPEAEEDVNEEEFVSFLDISLTTTDAIVALYVQFVLVVCFATFALLLAILVLKSRPSKNKSYGNEYKNSAFIVTSSL